MFLPKTALLKLTAFGKHVGCSEKLTLTLSVGPSARTFGSTVIEFADAVMTVKMWLLPAIMAPCTLMESPLDRPAPMPVPEIVFGAVKVARPVNVVVLRPPLVSM